MAEFINLSTVSAFFLGCACASVVLGMVIHRKAQQRVKENIRGTQASLDLLEKNEHYEEQKFNLAEAGVELLEKNEIIELARDQTEKLLFNILPVTVAHELMENGHSQPRQFERVTVCFADLEDFTRQSGSLSPQRLIGELNDIFTAFDAITERHNCERLKTIGDAYFSVCGMPTSDDKHAQNIARSALEMVGYLHERNQTAKLQWKLRIGLHTGPVVGGVVGTKKYIYDAFGDTINIASRMEAHSEPMKINTSRDVRELLQNSFRFSPRPPAQVKGKGTMEMYFLDAENDAQ
ncbi:MAG: adenylate/guanylate cyclase domain-containing protein [Aestuariibacter sp.]|nr:adenylate/guanylate cyclase domain-containing protein [Aestuariibacter sp.]